MDWTKIYSLVTTKRTFSVNIHTNKKGKGNNSGNETLIVFERNEKYRVQVQSQ